MAETKRKKADPKAAKKQNVKATDDSKAKEAVEKQIKQYRMHEEIWAIVIIALGIFFAIALQTTAAGKVGVLVKNFFCGLFGNVGAVLPYFFVIYGVMLLINKTTHLNKKNIILFSLTFLMISLMYSERFIDTAAISFKYITLDKWFLSGMAGNSGGAVGMLAALLVLVWFGKTGLYIFGIATIIVCVLLLVNTPISQFLFNYKAKKEAKKQLKQEVMEAEPEILEEKRQEIEEQIISEPMLAVNAAKERKNKKNILSYMLDDKLFTKKEEKAEVADSTKTQEFEQDSLESEEEQIKYGLDDKPERKEGFGIADYVENLTINEFEKKTLDDERKRKIWEEVDSQIAARNNSFFEKPTYNTVNQPGIIELYENESIKDARETIEDTNYIQDEFIDTAFDITEEIKETAGQQSYIKNEDANIIDKHADIANEESGEQEEVQHTEIPNNAAEYAFPPIELLTAPKVAATDESKGTSLQERADKLEQTLRDFKVDAHVTNVTQGPAVTRYEVQPNTGVKVNSIVKLSDDIALNMEARSIRIEAPIPGKPAVGIEIENESIKMIRLREILDSTEFKEAKSKITFAVGKDIEGNSVVADLKSMPHMLIAGSTGSGKSVCINSIIVSLIYKAKPSEVKLLLIDPKVVELGIYNSIPHMMIPVVTEPSKAAAALNWAVSEMNERYKKFASNGVRDLESYNRVMREKKLLAEVLPQIVIIIDELADLMMAAPSQVEDSICRLAQMARAAGMHLIVATQRPSVDVVTGVIKANIPSRIAFAVSSQFDSRTILDMAGAEKLVGKGDMLFAPMGSNKPTRVQGTFITDEEVNAVVDFFKAKGEESEVSESSKSLLASMEENLAGADSLSDFDDELMDEAIETVLKAQQASVSMLQRRFRIGYNRAARIVEDMEKLGIIGEADGSRPRAVNFTYDEYYSNLAGALVDNEIEENYKNEE